MNNKFIARSVATVMAVMMLGTVSFAASLTKGEAGADHTLTVDPGADQSIQTIMAYYSDTEGGTYASTDDIIVLDQASSLDDTFTVDASKTVKDWIVIKRGGSDGNTTGSISIKTVDLPENERATVTAKSSVTLGEATITDAVIFDHEFSPNGYTIESYGFDVTASVDGESSDTHTYAGTTTLSGETTYTLGLVFYGVPDNVDLSAQYFVNYAE